MGSARLTVRALPKGAAAAWLQPVVATQECGGLIVATPPDFSRGDGFLDFHVKYLNFKALPLFPLQAPYGGQTKHPRGPTLANGMPLRF